MYERYALVGRNGDLSSLSAKARVDMNGQMHAGNSCIDAEGIGEGQRRMQLGAGQTMCQQAIGKK